MFQKLLSRFSGSSGSTEGSSAVATGRSPALTAAMPPAVGPRKPVFAVAPVAAVLRSALPPGGVELLDEKIRRSLDSVPPLPQVAVKLLAELANPNSSAKSVAALATQDTSLATAILRTANSAAYAPVKAVVAVQDAVAMMGFSAIRALLLRMRLEAVVGAGHGSPEFEELWTHGLAVSQISEILATRFGGDRAVCSTLGLLHDIGKLIVMRTRPEAASQLKQRGPAGESYLGRERRVLGADHADIGAHLAARWGLPGELIEGIRFHHSPYLMRELSDTGNARKNVAIVHLANQLSKYLHLYSDDVEIDIVLDETWDILGSGGDVEVLIDERIRKAATDAILMAEAALGRPPSATGRVIRFSPAAELDVVLQEVQKSDVIPRVTQLEACDQDLFDMAASADDVQVLRFAHKGQVEDAARQVEEALASVAGSISMDRLAKVRLALRWLVASAHEINPQEPVELAIANYNGQVTACLRSEALRFDRRMGAHVDSDLATRVLDKECAGMMNLAWFNELAVSHDGGALRLAA